MKFSKRTKLSDVDRDYAVSAASEETGVSIEHFTDVRVVPENAKVVEDVDHFAVTMTNVPWCGGCKILKADVKY